MFCVSRNAYKMIIFAHSKCKRYENRKIQGVALPKKERNGQEWKSSHHGTHHGEQDYGTVLLQVVLHSIALEFSCQPIGGQEQGSRGNQQGHRAVVAFHPKGFRCACGKEVSNLLLIRINHLQQAVVAVISPLRHISCNRLVRHNQRAAGLGDFAHLAIEVFNGTCSVLAEHQPTDTVLRGVAI